MRKKWRAGPSRTVGWILATLVATAVAGCGQRAEPAATGLEIVGATATSQTSISVTFNRPVDATAADPANYVVTGPDGRGLGVVAAYPGDDGVSVTLATEPQEPVTYVLNVRNVRPAGGGSTTGEMTAQGGFGGSGEVAPVVASAIALSDTQVLITFADPTSARLSEMGPGALDPRYYRIESPGLDVLAAAYADGGRDRSRVVLTTASMEDRRYTVRVTNVLSAQGSKLVDPFLNAADFRGIAADDTVPPTIADVFATDNTTLVIQFSEPVSDDAASPARYTVLDPDGGELPVVSVVLNDVKTEATLTTWPMTAGVSYRVLVEGIEDRNGNAIAPGSEAGFDGTPVDASEDRTGPRVLSANSTGNTTVVVTFDEPVMGGSGSAENPANYSIVDSVQAGTLAPQAIVDVVGAELSGNKRAVTLTTRPQSEIGYTLKVTDVKDLVGNQIQPPDRERPYQTTFFGTGEEGPGTHSDGDGLTDAEEQFGWTVVVELGNGETTRRQVTSDPELDDTDGDGVSDADEKNYLTDPRDPDTDDDQLSDALELNAFYSDPVVQDSDGDGLADGLETVQFGTSPIFADTDGDGLDDEYEVTTANRNARIADLPRPQIRIGAVDLALDVRFETETRRGESAVDAKSRQVTLEQSESRSVSTTDAQTNEWFFKAGAEIGFETKIGIDNSTSISGSFSTEAGTSGSSTFQVSEESASASSRAYADTLSTENTFSREETLTRRVEAAEIGLLVDVQNLGNVAFEMTDLEITALVKDGRDPRVLTPVATLFPADPGLRIHLGALDSSSRGPFRFVTDGTYPSRVEDLMRNPRGIVFEVANFNIRDEEGRNFAFGEQEANDRTAPIVIDFGVDADEDGTRVRGAVERYRVATNAGFDEAGRPEGVPVAEALEEIIGLTHYDEDDPSQATAALSDEELRDSYSTFDLEGVRTIYRIRGTMPAMTLAEIRATGDAPPQRWMFLLENGLDESVDVRDFVLQPEHGVTLAFAQDLDEDGVPARVELYYGSSDDPAEVDDATDSDGDGVTFDGEPSDRFEIYGSQFVSIDRGLGDAIDLDEYEVRSSPARADTDGDGLSDWEEFHGCLDRDGDPGACDGDAFEPTDPTNPDSDGDRILDEKEVLGFAVDPVLGAPAFVTTNPADVDTDNDGIGDGDEVVFGGNPAVADVASFTDTDDDGLLDQEELDGWTVSYRMASTQHGVPGTRVTCTPSDFADCVDGNGVPRAPTSEPDLGNVDTDGDGLGDAEERELGTHPRLEDTDGDGIDDADEVHGTYALPFDGEARPSDPLDRDSDHDRLADGEELLDGWDVTLDGVTSTVRSDPTDADLDGDGLHDYDERHATAASGTDPNAPDTDGDGSTDKVEIDRLLDLDDANDTDPLAPDQVVNVEYALRGVRTTSDNICGHVSGGSAWITGNLSYTVNDETESWYYTSDGYNVGTSYQIIRTGTHVFRAVPGDGIDVGGTDITRWDGNNPYPLQNIDATFAPLSGELFGSVQEETFRLTQTINNPEDCVVQFRFTVTPQ